MILSTHNKIVKQIYNTIVETGEITVVNIIGEKGTGKQIVVDNLLELLIEGWDIHIISGSEQFKINRFAIKTKKRYEFFPINSISLKIGPLSIGSSLRFQEVDSIFCDIEKQFIKEINNDMHNSLILIENYDELDECEKKFVNTILFTKGFFKKNNVYFLVTSEQVISKSFNNIYVNTLSIDDVEELIKQIAADKNIDSKKILKLSRGNYELAKNLINYGCENENVLEEILSKRIKDVQKKVPFLSIDEIYEICIYGSYFLKGFSLQQIILLNKKEYSFEELFKLFINLNKIGIINSKYEIMNYDNKEFKKIIKNKSYDFSMLYLQKFYQFYTNNYDYLYFERLEYLLELFNRDNNKNHICKITGLIFINLILNIYNRTISTTSMLDSFLNKTISKITNEYVFPQKLYIILNSLINNTLTYGYLVNLNFESEDTLIRTEIRRLTLNLFSKECNSSELINQHINEAINFINYNSDFNYEKYAALRLQDTIIAQLQNRSTLYNKLKNEIKKYNELINLFKNINNDIYQYYKNLKYRRATLFEKCDIAIKQIQDAIAFNNDKKNIHELYNCYVNLLGLYVITSNEDSIQCKKLCKDISLLIGNNQDFNFDKPYKLSNNLLLIKFKSEIKNVKEENCYYNLVKKYCLEFKQLYFKSKSNVVRLNYISLMIQLNPKKGLKLIDSFIKENGDLFNLDSFYLYYLNNLKIMFFIINKDWDKANQLLKYLEIVDIPHYNLNDVYYKKRIEAFKIIIENKISCNTIREYDNIIQKTLTDINVNYNYFNGLDESWNFFSKGFILSDLQHYD